MTYLDSFAEDTITNIFDLLGVDYANGRARVRFQGPACLIGADSREMVVNKQDVETKVIEKDGYTFIQFGLGVRVRPNFGNRKIYFWLYLNEGADEYSLLVTRNKKIGCEVLRHFGCLPVENIQDVINNTYDELIKEICGGFIPL